NFFGQSSSRISSDERWHLHLHVTGESQPKAFIRCECEGSISHQWRAEGPAKVVLSQRCLRQAQLGLEPIVGIHGIVPQVIKYCAVELVTSGTTYDLHLTSGYAA